MTEVAYGQYAEAFKAIHQALLAVQAVLETLGLDAEGKIGVSSLPAVTGTVSVNDLLSDLTAPPSGKKVTKLAFTWNGDGSLASLRAYDGSDLLFTLTFTWSSGNLQDITRS